MVPNWDYKSLLLILCYWDNSMIFNDMLIIALKNVKGYGFFKWLYKLKNVTHRLFWFRYFNSELI